MVPLKEESKKIILASASPRRQALLSETGFDFKVLVKNIDEDFPGYLKREMVARYLADKKAKAYDQEVSEGFTVITADTIVCADNEILGKPEDADEAVRMLRKLSDRWHDVITAVCIRKGETKKLFHVETRVRFGKLGEDEIQYYISKCKPYDKAGAYGIQEWIGLTAITRIEGSYHNVVGLPTAEVYEALRSLGHDISL